MTPLHTPPYPCVPYDTGAALPVSTTTRSTNVKGHETHTCGSPARQLFFPLTMFIINGLLLFEELKKDVVNTTKQFELRVFSSLKSFKNDGVNYYVPPGVPCH